MVSNNGSLQLPAAPTASTMSTTVATADDIDVHRHESQDPLRPRVDLSAKNNRQKTLAALNRVVIFALVTLQPCLCSTEKEVPFIVFFSGTYGKATR